mgnify:CR=1 FL=1
MINKLSTKQKLLALLVVASAGAGIYLYFATKKTQAPLQITNVWKGVEPGKDSTKNVISKLGEPLTKETLANNNELYTYDSSNTYQPHRLYFSESKLDLVIERDVSTSSGELSKYLTQFGQPEAILPNQQSPVFYLYVYPSRGIAINANKNDGAVREVWYFPSTTLDQFKTTYSIQIGQPAEEKF